jgi:protease I
MENLEGLKVAILVDDGFERVKLVEPRKALDQAGAETRNRFTQGRTCP